MDINTIVSYVLNILPSFIAVLSTVGLVWKVIKNFKKLKDDVSNMTAMEDIRNQLKEVLQENAKLKKQLNETLTKIDKVHRG